MNINISFRDLVTQETVFSEQNSDEEKHMGDKRKDYISWDEYFMELPNFRECVLKIQIRRLDVV